MNLIFISIFALILNLAACAEKDPNSDTPPSQEAEPENEPKSPIAVVWGDGYVMSKPYYADGVGANDVTSGTLLGSLDVTWVSNPDDIFIDVYFASIDKPLEEVTSPADYVDLPELSIDSTRLKYMGISERGFEYANSKLNVVANGHVWGLNVGEEPYFVVDKLMLFSSYSTMLTAAEFEAYYFVLE